MDGFVKQVTQATDKDGKNVSKMVIQTGDVDEAHKLWKKRGVVVDSKQIDIEEHGGSDPK